MRLILCVGLHSVDTSAVTSLRGLAFCDTHVSEHLLIGCIVHSAKHGTSCSVDNIISSGRMSRGTMHVLRLTGVIYLSRSSQLSRVVDQLRIRECISAKREKTRECESSRPREREREGARESSREIEAETSSSRSRL